MQIQDLVEDISEKRAKKVLLQLPEGLKTQALIIMDELEKNGISVILSAEPCYGACDLRDEEAKKAGCDLLVHVGHKKFFKNIKTRVPVLYYPWTISADLNGIDFSMIREKRIGLLTTVQHLHMLKDVAKKLEADNKRAVIGGDILGCWTKDADRIRNRVDAFLFIGTGRFHPLGITDNIYCLDLEKKRIEKIDALFEKKRYARIFKAREARSFAILVSRKPGQYDLKKAEKLKEELRKRDKKAFILIMDEIRDEKLLGIKADAFINTACPRLIDTTEKIINAEDLKEVLK